MGSRGSEAPKEPSFLNWLTTHRLGSGRLAGAPPRRGGATRPGSLLRAITEPVKAGESRRRRLHPR